MKKIIHLLLVSVLIALLPLVTFAQDIDTTPEPTQDEPILLQILRQVPAIPDNRNNLYFMDRSAIEIAYPNVTTPASFAEFEESPQDTLWFKTIFRTNLPTAVYLMQMGNMPESIGIEYFDIDQELLYGVAPSRALILQGEFDTEAIKNTFSNRNYQPVGDGDLWCLEGDCTTGTTVDLNTRDLSNPFGGHLGRNEPVVIRENSIAGSTAPSQLGYDISGKPFLNYTLGEQPDVIDAVNAVSTLGTVLQVSMWEGMTIGSANNFHELLNNTSINLSQIGIDDRLGEIGFYTLALFGDVVTEDEQVAVIALTFSNPDSAERSLAEIIQRLETMSSLRTQEPFSDMLARLLATVSTDIYQGELYTVGLLQFSTPKITYEQLLEPQTSDEVVLPSDLYNWLLGLIISRDNAWMAFDALIIE